MKTLKNTPENAAKIAALKIVKETQWVGSLTYENIESCLASMNLNTCNSGCYKPAAGRIPGVAGIFLINEDGGIYFEQRIIKKDNGSFVVESLSNDGFDAFESKFIETLDA
jgi:hypothetical protein